MADVAKARGVFITLEGVDGCGKSTKADMLVDELSSKGREVVRLREPGGARVSELIREILLNPKNTEMSAECELLLMEASRAQNVAEIILPALERGAVVVCDRFYDSTYAYQGFGRGLDMELIRTANSMGSCGVTPDRTIVFDIDVDFAYERAINHSEADRMEAEGIPFQLRVREGYQALAREEPERVRIVNGDGEKEQVYARMVAELVDILPELGA